MTWIFYLTITIVLCILPVFYFSLLQSINAEANSALSDVMNRRPNPFTVVSGTNEYWLQDLRAQLLLALISLSVSVLLPFWHDSLGTKIGSVALQILTILLVCFLTYCFGRRKLILYCLGLDESTAD